MTKWMNVIYYITKDYENKSPIRAPKKQSQTSKRQKPMQTSLPQRIMKNTSLSASEKTNPNKANFRANIMLLQLTSTGGPVYADSPHECCSGGYTSATSTQYYLCQRYHCRQFFFGGRLMYVLDFPIIECYTVVTIRGVCSLLYRTAVGLIRSSICDAR